MSHFKCIAVVVFLYCGKSRIRKTVKWGNIKVEKQLLGNRNQPMIIIMFRIDHELSKSLIEWQE